MNIPSALASIRSRTKLTQEALARVLGVSFVSVNRWERGASTPSPVQAKRILDIYQNEGLIPGSLQLLESENGVFASRGVRRRIRPLPLFKKAAPEVKLRSLPLNSISQRLVRGRFFTSDGHRSLLKILKRHSVPALTTKNPPQAGMSAGKNTYTYDAHTYHTKVPPQGIAELIKHYLPAGGLVFDPFSGSGMTGVAARALGDDCILNELSPAACFISNRFVSSVEPATFDAGVRAVLDDLKSLRAALYTTTCRECGSLTEILYTVWSYNVLCNHCSHEFLLWDHCRKYGSRVREHKILTEFSCPSCKRLLKKSRLKRTIAEPVQLGYMCCRSRQQEVVHPLNKADLEKIHALEVSPPLADGFFPTTMLPDGVNLRQPKHHGLDRIDRFYTPRNLSAMSHIWKAIHRVENTALAAHLAFVATSLYQRVTRLSEFRFWGGSGNTARFNVPFIFNEANVFVTFSRKARTIQDHLETTASFYRGDVTVVQNSACRLDYLPDECVDLIFTDPPFGANINYSEMNFLWEAWLGKFTDVQDEAVINRVQGKDIDDYRRLMTDSLKECYRVLRKSHWLLLVFMNSNSNVWVALRSAILESGFEIRQADIFDKHHGTFKQFVSENTAGFDLVLHCFKPSEERRPARRRVLLTERESVFSFLEGTNLAKRINVYLHVGRKQELDVRKLYSEWTARSFLDGTGPLDFSRFRGIVNEWLRQKMSRG